MSTSESETIRVLRIRRPGLGSYVEADLGVATVELEEHFAEGGVGDEVTFEIVEMTRAEYDALPEFTGW